MLELYHAGLTTCSKKVRLCLREKQLSYRSHYLSMARFEHQQPAYLRLNPDGVVPTLVHDGAAIRESSVINEYLEDRFPDLALRPADPLATARMRWLTKLGSDYGLESVQYLTERRSVLTMIARANGAVDGAGRVDPDRLRAVVSTMSVSRTRERLLVLIGQPTDDHAMAKATAAATRIVTAVEAALETGPWLLGSFFSMADIELLPFLDRHETYHPGVLNADNAPRTMAWLDRMRARPAVAEVFAPSSEAPALAPGIGNMETMA